MFMETTFDDAIRAIVVDNDMSDAVLKVIDSEIKDLSPLEQWKKLGRAANVLAKESLRESKYTVKANETAKALSSMYGCSEKELLEHNGMRLGDILKPGTEILFP